ncbi:lipocalin-like domain-containing protein [Chitinophaga pinensis]|uniref:Lipocalin-like domain-containing protein n=1 Tax=Chitinophaga pinensis (strain ATCC 43595 / DSM 2588 / LMG 13176 / NBRC 15968 / NCIMB 11800 / UQM 2034) TaxID=485918 RepID=A0A979H0H7_CHIPD|nr:lipocalin family protein [Chitinophaga pinensis]ACU63455.1 hypothetical protein Cpin_6043 [Chitinophaga pinensis DSM 2588]
MKRISLLTCAIALLFVTCKKDDHLSPVPDEFKALVGRWKLVATYDYINDDQPILWTPTTGEKEMTLNANGSMTGDYYRHDYNAFKVGTNYNYVRPFDSVIFVYQHNGTPKDTMRYIIRKLDADTLTLNGFCIELCGQKYARIKQ